MVQLALPVRLADHAAFDSFHPVGNELAVDCLQRLVRQPVDRVVWLWGPSGVGKSHLLQAVCLAAQSAGHAATYLPLGRRAELDPGVLRGLDSFRIVCADDLHAVAGRADWERALFTLYEGLSAQRGSLLVAAHGGPRAIAVALPDLASRLAAGPVYRLRRLPEAERLRALQLRAARRGLELSAEAGRYLLRHQRRDMASLFALLDRLDAAALAAQRRLSVPFIREVLGGG